MKKIILATLIAAISYSTSAYACTTWASIGVNKTKATYIVKNRDAGHKGNENLKVFQGEKYKYLALIYRNTKSEQGYPYISAGINQAGISVVNNAASSVKTINRDQGETITMRKILSQYGSVAEILKDKKKLFRSSLVNNLILAGPKQIAVIEIGKHGKYHVKTKKNGVLYHTNQYESNKLKKQNKIKLPDSIQRYKTIKKLLDKKHQPYSMEYFLWLTNRQYHGTNASIFRKWTVATWAATIPANGTPSLYVRFTIPTQSYAVYRLTLNQDFWQHPKYPDDQ